MRSLFALSSVIALVSGCVTDDLVDCANGTACPGNLVCDTVHDLCVTHAQDDACEDDDIGSCLTDSACHDGFCLPIACGNHLVDPLEACDDGNLIDNDGCAANCMSNETCGNGVVDYVKGEQCDKGDIASHDGCDSKCFAEDLAWTTLVQTDVQLRSFAAFAYDTDRHKLVVFGGETDSVNAVNTVAEMNVATQTWLVRDPEVAPTDRKGAAAAYDEERHVTVIFGGRNISTFGDTWSWDGETWRSMTPAQSPGPRWLAAMTYDSERKRVLLHGGAPAMPSSIDDRTWSWDGLTWTPLPADATHPSPPARDRAAMVYDAERDETILYGGQSDGSVRSDMWILRGDTWTEIVGHSEPGERLAATLTFDPVRKTAVLAGGSYDPNGRTWEWNGTQWTLRLAVGTVEIERRIAPAAYFDRDAGSVVLALGESVADPTTFYDDVRTLSDGGWDVLKMTPGPTVGGVPSMVYDRPSARVFMFGGVLSGNNTPVDTMWEHDGSVWRNLPVEATMPPARTRAATTYDTDRDLMFMFSGSSSSDLSVWERSHGAWVEHPASGTWPRQRTSAAATYDPISKCVVMYGGTIQAVPIGPPDEMWLWCNGVWSQVPEVAVWPGNRVFATMTYDNDRHEVVMFGGFDVSGAKAETWTWTKAGGWTLRTPASEPPARLTHVMTDDPLMHRVVTFGGAGLGDTWTWNGTTWTQQFPTNPPGPSGNVVGAYNLAHHSMLVYGPTGTLRLQMRGPTRDEVCTSDADLDGDEAAGCDDPDCAVSCMP